MSINYKLLTLVVFITGILFSELAFAQCPDNIHLSRQSQVDSFFILYPDCRNAKAILISGNDIVHLGGMLGVKTVDTFLIDNNSNLKSLYGLDSLVSCKRKLRINNNDELENLTGLESFTGPTWTLHIVDNLRLKNLKGLDNLEDAISINVHYCDSITSLDGLQKLGPKTGILVGVTPLLTSLKGLENLTSVATLSLSFTGLKSLDELSNLKQCGGVPYNSNFYQGGLGISYNDSLQSLHGLHNVIKAGFISIENNPLLKSYNQLVLDQVIVGSYDPNDKAVDRNVISPENRNAPLEYTIRFQNTGTYYASFVDIIDTIKQGLDLRTFEMIACSHPCVVTFPDTNIIRWRFDNILLPDSTHNEILSHGFVKFRINAWVGWEEKKKIENKASICFDYNLPVITNAATTIIRGQCLDDFYFTRQSQIDSFPLVYPECDSLLSLYISGNDIEDLSPLSNIKSVSENLTIVNNPLLFDLRGLDNLEFGGSLFEIQDNQNLLSLEGLNSLTTVGFLAIEYNSRLKNLEGLEQLASVSSIYILANDSLLNLDGLDGIITNAWIYILDNPKLASLTGLHNMTTAGNLVIANNDALLNLNGLENVRYLGELILDDNALLESITAFEKLQTVDYGVAIINNYDLTRCAIDFFCDSLFHPFLENQIFYNGPSCNSLDEILASCNITGVNEMDVLENISIYPNPSTGSFYLQFDSKENFSVDIELLDQSGIVVFNENFDAITNNRFIKQFDLRSYSSGVYFLKLVTAEGITTKKVFLTKK